jgi:hypothetical protein
MATVKGTPWQNNALLASRGAVPCKDCKKIPGLMDNVYDYGAVNEYTIQCEKICRGVRVLVVKRVFDNNEHEMGAVINGLQDAVRQWNAKNQ